MPDTLPYPLHGGPWDGLRLPFPPGRLPRLVCTTLVPERPLRVWLGRVPDEPVAVYEWVDGRLVFTHFCDPRPRG